MKFVRGSRLDEYAAQGASLRDRLRKFQAVCDAVAFAHAHGVIHRDLKPQNIMIGSFGEVLVMDWGVAKIRDDPSQSAVLNTSDGTVIGTRHYMSPEQARGEVDIDERSDIYSLGAVLKFLLSDQKVSKPAKAIYSKAMSQTYRENALEKAGRWIGKNRFLVLLVLAYLLMRIFLIFTARR
jgi:serine/threonine-protein kinase